MGRSDDTLGKAYEHAKARPKTLENSPWQRMKIDETWSVTFDIKKSDGEKDLKALRQKYSWMGRGFKATLLLGTFAIAAFTANSRDQNFTLQTKITPGSTSHYHRNFFADYSKPPRLTLAERFGDRKAVEGFDVVVIGGGFAGLHTALRLGEKGQRVLVIEKGRVGSGASGMSAGVVVPAFEPRPEALNSRTPFSRFLAERTDARDALFQNCCDALQRMRDIIWYYNIECAFEDSGTLLIKHTAKSPKEYIKDDNLNDLATLRSSTFGIKTSMASKDFLYQTAQEYQAAPPKKNVHPGKSPDVKILGQTLEPPSYDADPVKTRSPVIPVLGQDVRLSVKDESIRWAYHAQRNFSVNSFQFCVGLADTIERFAGCGVVEKSEAVEVQDVRASDPLYPLMLRVRCEGSVGNHYVKARHVVCCTNAVPWWFSAWHSLQNIAIYSSILVTKPFPKGKLDEALTTYANIVDNEAGAVFRRLPGDRLLWSGNVNTRPHSTEQLSGHEDLYLQQIEAAFPVLRGWISTESLWQGQSFSGQAPLCPLVGRTRTPRLWVNAGHYCNGLTSACAAGVVVADAILEGYHTEDINDLRPIPSKLKAWEHCRPWAPIIAPAKQLWAAYVAPRYVSVQSN